jgi:hypothetical protein
VALLRYRAPTDTTSNIIRAAATCCGVQGAQTVQQLPEFGPGLRILGPIQQDQLRVLLQMWAELLPELQVAALEARPAWALAWSAAGRGDDDKPHATSSHGSNSDGETEQAENEPICSLIEAERTSAEQGQEAGNPFEEEQPGHSQPDALNPFTCPAGDDSLADTAINPFEPASPTVSGSQAHYNPFETPPRHRPPPMCNSGDGPQVTENAPAGVSGDTQPMRR